MAAKKTSARVTSQGKAFAERMAKARTAKSKKPAAKAKSKVSRATSNMNAIAKHIAGGGKVRLAD